jgi:hypothetical protein
MNTARIRTAATAAAALVLAGLSVPAAAQTQSNIVNSAERTETSSATSSSQPAAERRLCVRAEMTGTRLVRNVCRTRAEWNRAGGIPQAD